VGAQGDVGPTGPTPEFANEEELVFGVSNDKAISPAILRSKSLHLDVPYLDFGAGNVKLVTFSPIQPWVKRVTLMIWDMKTDSTNMILIRFGHGAGTQNSGYRGTALVPAGTSPSTHLFSSAFAIHDNNAQGASALRSGAITFNYLGYDNIWTASGSIIQNSMNSFNTLDSTSRTIFISGSVSLAAQLSYITIQTHSDLVAFSSGYANILME
jgi:hypothetical protein